jgi:hypothetical protein
MSNFTLSAIGRKYIDAVIDILRPYNTSIANYTGFNPFASLWEQGTGLGELGNMDSKRCSSLPTPIRFHFGAPLTYLMKTVSKGNVTINASSLLADTCPAFNMSDPAWRTPVPWNEEIFIGNAILPVHQWHMFYKRLLPVQKFGTGQFLGRYTGYHSVCYSDSTANEAISRDIPLWSNFTENITIAKWFDFSISGRVNARIDTLCIRFASKAYSTSFLADGGPTVDGLSSCPAFSCDCPLGRTGNACQVLDNTNGTGGSANWETTADLRGATFGISHYGTPCQSRRSNDGFDVPNSTNCGDTDTSGRAGCVNGVWDWQRAKCRCDFGWSTPVENGDVRRNFMGYGSGLPANDALSWAQSPYYRDRFGCANGACGTKADKAFIVNPFYMCIIPWAQGNASAVCGNRNATATQCATGDPACQPCNGRGTCTGPAGCRCNPGYYGKLCQFTVASICDLVNATRGVPRLPNDTVIEPMGCSGHGTCSISDIRCNCGVEGVVDTSCCTVTGICDCVRGRGYGWDGLDCSRPYIVAEANGTGGGCLNNGTLRADPPNATQLFTASVGHRVWCDCPPLFTGLRCELSVCPVGPNGLACNGRGTCGFRDGRPSCKQQLNFPNGGGVFPPYTYGRFNGQWACVPPGGFSSEHPPFRWEGEACDIDTFQSCARLIPNTTTWRICGPLGGEAAQPPMERPEYRLGCEEVATSPGVFKCNCNRFAQVNSGPYCDSSPCINPKDQLTCSDVQGKCVTVAGSSYCDCRDPNPYQLGNDLGTTDSTEAVSLDAASPMRAGTFCEINLRTCRVAYSGARLGDVGIELPNGTWVNRRNNERIGSQYWSVYTCTTPSTIDPVTGLQFKGACRLPQSGVPAVLKCFCDSQGLIPCTDNSCQNCVARANVTVLPTSAPTSAPTFQAGSNQTHPPTGAPTSAPTAESLASFEFESATGNTTCSGVAAFRRYCMSTRGPINPIRAIRAGSLAGSNVTFTATPAFETIGLRFNRTTGVASGQPNRSGTFVFTVRADVGGVVAAAAAGGLELAEATSFASVVTIDVLATCPYPCTTNSYGCNQTTGTTEGTCVCRGIWFTANASAPCAAHPCTGLAFPDPDTASACMCSDTRMSPALGCTASGCPSSAGGVICGTTIVRAQTNLDLDPSKECINSKCVCSFPYALNASTGLCDPLCDPNATASATATSCSCSVSAVPRRDPASGCYNPYCYHNGTYDTSVPNAPCTCPFPFNGTACSATSSPMRYARARAPAAHARAQVPMRGLQLRRPVVQRQPVQRPVPLGRRRWLHLLGRVDRRALPDQPVQCRARRHHRPVGRRLGVQMRRVGRVGRPLLQRVAVRPRHAGALGQRVVVPLPRRLRPVGRALLGLLRGQCGARHGRRVSVQLPLLGPLLRRQPVHVGLVRQPLHGHHRRLPGGRLCLRLLQQLVGRHLLQHLALRRPRNARSVHGRGGPAQAGQLRVHEGRGRRRLQAAQHCRRLCVPARHWVHGLRVQPDRRRLLWRHDRSLLRRRHQQAGHHAHFRPYRRPLDQRPHV